MDLADISPVRSRTTITIDRHHQSVSGKALCVAMSAEGERLYLGGHSGVWRSDDGGRNWVHPERPTPPAGTTTVPGALLPPAVYDLLMSPSNPDVVLAATGRDSRQPSQSGIYRSTDAGSSWVRVHVFLNTTGTVGNVGSLAVAPDDPNLMFAGSQFGIAVSSDGGRTWVNQMPQTSAGQSPWYVAGAPAGTAGRRVFAVGSRVWSSLDGGQTWIEDAVDLPVGSPADGLGQCARCICIDPTDSNVLYVARDAGELWRGRFPETGTAPAEWTQLPAPPNNFSETTASGTDFIVVHHAPGDRRLLLYSDRSTVHVAEGDPNDSGDWTRIDGSPVHVDPHGIAITPLFRWKGAGGASGRIVLVNDGGSVVSNSGADSWEFGAGLSTLGLVNTAVLPRAGKEPGLVIQMGDNNGFFSRDGGRHWRTQDYRGGDNDCSFADTRQSERLVVFAPRHDHRAIFLYTASDGDIPNGSWDTDDRHTIAGPPPPPGEKKSLWTAVSNFYNLGYRPLVLTLDGEEPRPGGDFVTILVSDDRSTARLVRTTVLSEVSAGDWLSTATEPGSGAKVIQQGPVLPTPDVSVVQPSGGHVQPTFYVGDQDEGRSQAVWRWRRPQTDWQPVVPHGGTPGPQRARRFFVDPYRPEILYVLDTDHVWRTDNGGTDWAVDAELERALTQDGAFPVDMTTEAGGAQVLLRDMAFDASAPQWRVAVGPAGVFVTLDGRSWTHLLHSAAAGCRPNNVVVDDMTDRSARTIYVSTSNRGVLQLGPLGLTFNPPLLNFGSVKVGTAAQRTLTLQNRTGVRLDVSVTAPTSGPFTWAALDATLDDGEARQVNVQFRPATNAIARGRLSVRSLAAGSPHSVGLIGKGPGGFPQPDPDEPPPPILKVTPTTISFGSLPLGTVATRTVTIENATGAAVSLSIAGPPGGSRFSWQPFAGNLANGAKHLVTITFGPVQRGIATGTLTVVSDAPGSPHHVSIVGKSIGGF